MRKTDGEKKTKYATWEKRNKRQNKSGTKVFCYWKNKVPLSSFIGEQAQLNKQHLETSNSPNSCLTIQKDRQTKTGSETQRQAANRLIGSQVSGVITTSDNKPVQDCFKNFSGSSYLCRGKKITTDMALRCVNHWNVFDIESSNQRANTINCNVIKKIL